MARGKNDLSLMHVSMELHELVKEIESHTVAVAEATFYRQRDEAYTKLHDARRRLYEYVAPMEKRCGVTQNCKVRF